MTLQQIYEQNRGTIMKTHNLMSALAVTVSSTALFIAAASPAFAQQDSAPQDSAVEEATGADAIIVTGTRRTDRTVADSTVPVDVISGDALLNSGQTETNKLLNQLVPSFNFPQPSLTDGPRRGRLAFDCSATAHGRQHGYPRHVIWHRTLSSR